MWTRKKNEEKDEKSEYFLKICLTNNEKMNIYIGWPVNKPSEKTVDIMTILLNGILNGLFSESIIKNLQSFNNPIINEALTRLTIDKKTNYISPLDVL